MNPKQRIIDTLLPLVSRFKHLPGEHDQQRHGRGSGSRYMRETQDNIEDTVTERTEHYEQYWKKRLVEHLEKIDPRLREFVQLHAANGQGTNIVLGDTMFDIHPELRNVEGWDRASGAYSKDGTIAMPYKRVNSEGELDSSFKNGSVLVHEYGHAFDDAYGHATGKSLSETQKFKKVYENEAAVLRKELDKPRANLPAGVSKSTANYFANKKSGASEFVAESFASEVLGSAPSFNMSKTFAQYFPKSSELVKQAVKDVIDENI